MTITSRVHGELFAPAPPTTTTTTTITPRRTYASNHHTSNNLSPSMNRPVKLIRMPLHNPRVDTNPKAVIKNQRRRERRQRGRNPNKQQLQPKGAGWTADEHERFLRGLELFPHGPWKEVANFVGTRSVRQTMTHAQKYRQKIARHQRGLHPGYAITPRVQVAPTTSSCIQGSPATLKEEATNAATTEIAVPNDEWIFAQSDGKCEPSATTIAISNEHCTSLPPVGTSSSTDDLLLDLCLEGLTSMSCVDANDHHLDQSVADQQLLVHQQPLANASFTLDSGVFNLDFGCLTSEDALDDSALDDIVLEEIMTDDVIRCVIEKYLDHE